ncbi:ANTAR domain-containing protein [Aeromicrobium sp. Leaf350]|uniref:ANTAR domain-containing protein n=1 Tax=Aeromicrobium sp. Leaf350 TaxID=2876565 RepID=UPI001E290503|nr:GAF and ANTAR domain-containing protein [Aeromicrobium sp. Leaf350]
MDVSGAAHALARASASMTDHHDVSGGLAALVRSCVVTMHVDSAGILVGASGELEPVSSASHGSAELDLLHAQVAEGPCVDAFRTDTAVEVVGRENLLARWPTYASTMIGSGFEAVLASPLRWQHRSIGALGLFRRADVSFSAEDIVFAQAFADMATLLILSTEGPSTEALAERLDSVLSDRIAIEQAKGVLAERHGLTMAAAYDRLVSGAVDHHAPLATWAVQVVRDALRSPDELDLPPA